MSHIKGITCSPAKAEVYMASGSLSQRTRALCRWSLQGVAAAAPNVNAMGFLHTIVPNANQYALRGGGQCDTINDQL